MPLIALWCFHLTTLFLISTLSRIMELISTLKKTFGTILWVHTIRHNLCRLTWKLLKLNLLSGQSKQATLFSCILFSYVSLDEWEVHYMQWLRVSRCLHTLVHKGGEYVVKYSFAFEHLIRDTLTMKTLSSVSIGNALALQQWRALVLTTPSFTVDEFAHRPLT